MVQFSSNRADRDGWRRCWLWRQSRLAEDDGACDHQGRQVGVGGLLSPARWPLPGPGPVPVPGLAPVRVPAPPCRPAYSSIR